METVNKKRAVSLGLRVGIIFLTAVIAVIIVAYFVLSQNFQSLLTNYTIGIVESMTKQGVKMVENELETGMQEVSLLADSFQAPASGEEAVTFPQSYTEGGHLRMVYITETETFASDGRKRDIRERKDIRSAFAGETAVYGPYFNEENEYVVCYSAPIRDGDDIIGVLSVEKDGYRFCELIENIRFIHTGESYIINAEGTDIAVSDPEHIDWVNTQYNAQRLLEQEADEETKSIVELERKGLNGETGIGSYYWDDGLCYVFYEPIPSVNWVFLAGLREEEIRSMTQSTLFASISKGPVLGICFSIFFLLTLLIIYWIISNMKKSAEINEKLEAIANYDSLTGLMNRNSYHAALEKLSMEEEHSLACVYIDANGLHELNNHLGHLAGDQMLKAVADALRHEFPKDAIYRIGGDEFVVLCCGKLKQEIDQLADKVRQSLHSQNYEASIGISWREHNSNIGVLVNEAETAMQQDKQQFYRNHGHERRMRVLNKQLEQMIVEKQDADAFLTVLAPEFKGVYFVNLNKDSVRHLYIPSYFEECLRETEHQFSKALRLYACRTVKPEYRRHFEELCDYAKLQHQLNSNYMLEFIYQKTNGDWLKLRVLKFRDYTSEQQETLWIFAGADNSEAI